MDNKTYFDFEDDYAENGESVVAKAPHLNGDYLPSSVRKAVDLLGGIEETISPGDEVMIKPNFNCTGALPLSTDLDFLGAVIEMLQGAGAEVKVGELSGRNAWPTEEVVSELGVLPVLKRYGVEFVNFHKDRWVEMDLDTKYWDSIKVPESIYEVDKRVYLANMRCHSSARFTASLKLSVGWINLQDREKLHEQKSSVEYKIPDLHLGWRPDLVMIDGRRSTVTPSGRGDYVYPNLIMASGDMVALDTEAVKTLKEFPEDNEIDVPLEEMGQLSRGVELGLGSMDYKINKAPPNTSTDQ